MKKVTPIGLVHKPNGELLFALINADIIDPNGKKALPIALIRGHASIIILLARNRLTGEERFVMIRQFRTGSGAVSLEFPAGMLDRKKDPLSIAVKELYEETGILVGRSALKPLVDKILHTSSGLQDEGIFYYGCKLTMSDTEFRAIDGRQGGDPGEGEDIQVVLRTEQQAIKEATSAQVLLGFYLFREKMGGRRKLRGKREGRGGLNGGYLLISKI